MNSTLRFCAATPLLLLIPSLSCQLPVPQIVAPDLPADIAFVVNNQDLFDSDLNGHPTNLIPGTTQDAIARIFGCWGNFLSDANVPGPFPDTLRIDSLSTIHFDPTAGTAVRTTWLRDTSLAVNELFIESGTFELLDEARLRLSFNEFFRNDPATGEIVEITDAQPTATVMLATMRAEWLALWPESEPAPASGVFPLRRQFACPNTGEQTAPPG